MATTASVSKELKNLTTDREIYDFTEEVNKLDAKINPLTVLTNQIGKRGSIDGVKHVWYQEELDNPKLQQEYIQLNLLRSQCVVYLPCEFDISDIPRPPRFL